MQNSTLLRKTSPSQNNDIGPFIHFMHQRHILCTKITTKVEKVLPYLLFVSPVTEDSSAPPPSSIEEVILFDLPIWGLRDGTENGRIIFQEEAPRANMPPGKS